MQRLAVRMTVGAVFFAVAMFAIPTAFFSSLLLWNNASYAFQARVDALSQILNSTPSFVFRPEILLNSWQSDPNRPFAYIHLVNPSGKEYTVGEPLPFPRLSVSRTLNNGTELVAQRDVSEVLGWIIISNISVLAGAAFLLLISYLLAKRAARTISAPLVFLAAQAQQIGAGQLRGKMAKSGIEEIDLVQEELARSAERMAERIAAERQFSRDVSHQIRTPLTALSLRLEEIEYLNEDSEIDQQVKACIGQTERLAEVIDVLLKQVSKRGGGTAQSLSVLEVFSPLQEEWEDAFKRANRQLIFQDDSTTNVLATPAALSQILATLLENSLNYGGGTTRVLAQNVSDAEAGFLISVSDEGSGIPDEIAEKIFEKGFSGRGSTGLGLGIARALVTSDGGSLTLTQRRPPTFLVTLPAARNTELNETDNGALVISGRRRTRLH
ncbi:HAMP domain-containing histidine kinase [Actinomycetaceae bacterium TAE3-ERU4]|nr:HAMP domain-containing histidine kinase [Actinomycetaceae bacterium TAE3-ERU4]